MEISGKMALDHLLKYNIDSLDRIHDFVNDAVKFSVLAHLTFHFLYGMQYRRVMFAAEFFSDERQRVIGQFLAHVHSNLSGFNNILRVVFGPEQGGF